METTRRDFFRTAGRYSILTGMVGGAILLVAENRVTLQGCGDNRFCENCRKMESCSLDPAILHRKAKINEPGSKIK